MATSIYSIGQADWFFSRLEPSRGDLTDAHVLDCLTCSTARAGCGDMSSFWWWGKLGFGLPRLARHRQKLLYLYLGAVV